MFTMLIMLSMWSLMTMLTKNILPVILNLLRWLPNVEYPSCFCLSMLKMFITRSLLAMCTVYWWLCWICFFYVVWCGFWHCAIYSMIRWCLTLSLSCLMHLSSPQVSTLAREAAVNTAQPQPPSGTLHTQVTIGLACSSIRPAPCTHRSQ